MKYRLSVRNLNTDEITNLGTYETKCEALRAMDEYMYEDYIEGEFDDYEYRINGKQQTH